MQSCVWKKRPKNTSGGPSGDPFWDPKWPQIDVGGTEIVKIFDQKSSWNEFRIPDGPRIASGPFPGGATPFWTRRERFTPHVRGSLPAVSAHRVLRGLIPIPPPFGFVFEILEPFFGIFCLIFALLVSWKLPN